MNRWRFSDAKVERRSRVEETEEDYPNDDVENGRRKGLQKQKLEEEVARLLEDCMG